MEEHEIGTESESNDAVEKIDSVDSDEKKLQEHELSIQVVHLNAGENMDETTSKEEHGLKIGCEFTSYADLIKQLWNMNKALLFSYVRGVQEGFLAMPKMS